MTVTAKDLRLKTSDILKRVQRVGGVTVTLRGKPVARLVSIRGAEPERDLADYPAVGIWADRKEMKNPAAWVRKIRRPRCRNRREQRAVEDLVNGWFAEIIPVDAGVSRLSVRLMQQFGLSHRPGMAEVLIAATALETGEALATSNVKHFRFVPGLALVPFKPPK